MQAHIAVSRVVGRRTMLQSGRSRVRVQIGLRIFFFLIFLILPAALGPEIYSASNEISTRNRKKSVSVE
jgi:hypothetical protein